MEADDIDKIVKWLQVKHDSKLEKEYKDFLLRIKEENPQEYKHFYNMMRTDTITYFQEGVYNHETLDFIHRKMSEKQTDNIGTIKYKTAKGQLTRKQLEIYELYYEQKKSKKEIAQELNIKRWAVDYRIRNLNKKLN